MTSALYDQDLFFNLPVHEDLEPELAILESSSQPTGFLDESGSWWVAVKVDGQLKRQQIL